MRDFDVRQALTASLKAAHAGEPGTLIREELGLEHGQVFVDVAVINGELHGYELKSERDTLARLPRQVEAYSAVLDRATLVVSTRHVEQAIGLVPAWWGIKTAATQRDGSVKLRHLRKARRNPQQQMPAMVRLLWRDEALSLLESLGAAKGLRSNPRKMLYERVVELLPAEALRAEVRRLLKVREDW
ncbi:sce7726 family protein [Corallococcus macrosporus]|uniref:Sce7726 family protein n=1 Tax=Corallococcus macrosporus TaxID=35 RepID=A0ABS3D6P3_9BACT|nr:sce7726 family protein [Corallococcus macrosporus]MBN8226696.1 sce7726 family protein [Corallococcus macrosporus]